MPKHVATKASPEGGGHPTIYPGKGDPISIKLTEKGRQILEDLMRRHGRSRSDAIEGRLRGEI